MSHSGVSQHVTVEAFYHVARIDVHPPDYGIVEVQLIGTALADSDPSCFKDSIRRAGEMVAQ